MADAAKSSGKLEKLAKLKRMKSGLKTASAASDSPEDALDALLGDIPDDAASAPESRPAPVMNAAPKKQSARVPEPEEPVAEAEDDADPESLSAYFEALGFTPKEELNPKTAAKAAQPAPKPAPKPEPVKPARELDEGDLWQDPVRSDAMLEKMAQAASGAAPEPEPETAAPVAEDDDQAALDALLRDLDTDALTSAVEAEPETAEPEEAATDEPEIFEMPEPEDLDAMLSKAESDSAAPEEPAAAPKSGVSTEEDDGRLSIVFDESRAKLLDHVSRQMNCSIDDVVVTAVDWYLDALFGEDGDMMQGNG